MSQQNRPVPAPRKKFNLPSHSMDDELLSSSSTPQSERYSRDSSAPRVLPRSLSTQNDTVYDKQQKMGMERIKFRPPPPPAKPPKKQLTKEADSLDETSSSDEEMKPWREITKELQLRGSSEIIAINTKAVKLYKAIQMYIRLISEHGGDLKSLIHELNSISDNLNKFSKNTKIAGITGGASSAAGGVAAAAGVILAPFTGGASLALTVVGAGVAAAGGVTGASAAIAHKANLNQDTKRLDKTLNDFSVRYDEILTCLRYINEGMDQLKQYGVAFLNKTLMDSKAAACAVKLATGEASAMASEKSSTASGMLKGFAVGMDFYFTQDKDGQKLKKGLESKLAKKVRKLADDLDEGLKELMNINDVFSKHV
ncbi:apolipoprotein L6 [Fundulus heteroclitus]|nr:apolipoprotein L6 [Fundulus heteroclitus]